MSETFDPYHAWLGIPPKQQPPTHYRLLAIEPFESDPSVIESAADQRMAHLRTFQTGKRDELTQRLLNEVAAAKVCLLDPVKKAAYDAALRQQQAAEESDAVAADVFASAVEISPKPSSPTAKAPTRSKRSAALVAGSAAIVLVLIAACIFLSDIFLSKNPSDEPQSVAKTDTPPVGQAASLPAPENATHANDASAPSNPAEQPVAANPDTEQPPAVPQPAADETIESLLKAARLSENLLKPDAWNAPPTDWHCDRQGDLFVCDNRNDSKAMSGAVQLLVLNQNMATPIFVSAESKAENVVHGERQDYSIYLDLVYTDGTPLQCQEAKFEPGTHLWQRRELVIRPEKPVRELRMYLMLRKCSGKAWFRAPELRVLKTADALAAMATAKPSTGQASVSTTEVKRHPVPSAETQREIGAAIEETYKTSEAKTPEAKIQLAKDLSAAAGNAAKPEEQYVLLRKAIDLACDGGDAALMLETIGPMTEAFAIDPLVAKAAMIERFAKGPRSPARVQSLAESSRGVIEEALAEDRYEMASNLARTVADACSRSTPQVRKEAADRRKRVQQARKQFEEVQKALETLKASPEDAEANLTAGSWYCFVKDDCKTGLAHLAKGSDPLLKSLAGRELSSPPATPEDQFKLADAWWDAATERRGEQQAAMLRTAGHWYEQALGQLQGINKTKAEKRLSQIAELAQDTPSRPGREPPAAIAPFDIKRARGYQLQWARYLKVPVEFTNSIGMKFVLIPPGEFDMGTKEQEVERLRKQARQRALPDWHTSKLPFEAPQHRVKITRAYYLSLCEVTQAQYTRVIGSNPSEYKVSGPDAPVDNVSWNETVAFCRRLSEFATGKTPAGEYRLPTEAEWEFACRAGATAAFCFGDDESVLSDYAWTGKNADGKTRPVAQRKPNQFGLYDVHGNVWEWCADVFSRDYYRQSPPADPPGPTTGSMRVLRGGYAGDSFADGFRCALRNSFGQDGRDRSFGFRVAKSISAVTTTAKETRRPADAAAVNLPDPAQRLSPSTADQTAGSSTESAAENPKSRGEKSKPQPGTVLAEHQHQGWCGHDPRDNTYTLKTEAGEPLGRTYIRFKAGPVRESNGRILVSLDGDTFHPFAVWTTATCLESLKTTEGWQTSFFPPAVDKLRLKQIRIMFQHQSGPDGLTVYYVIWMKK